MISKLPLSGTIGLPNYSCHLIHRQAMQNSYDWKENKNEKTAYTVMLLRPSKLQKKKINLPPIHQLQNIVEWTLNLTNSLTHNQSLNYIKVDTDNIV